MFKHTESPTPVIGYGRGRGINLIVIAKVRGHVTVCRPCNGVQTHSGALNNVSPRYVICLTWLSRGPREKRINKAPARTASDVLQHAPFVLPKLKTLRGGGGPEDLQSSRFYISIYARVRRSAERARSHGNALETRQALLKTKKKKRYPFQHNATWVGVRDELADSCRYLEPDVPILGLG